MGRQKKRSSLAWSFFSAVSRYYRHVSSTCNANRIHHPEAWKQSDTLRCLTCSVKPSEPQTATFRLKQFICLWLIAAKRSPRNSPLFGSPAFPVHGKVLLGHTIHNSPNKHPRATYATYHHPVRVSLFTQGPVRPKAEQPAAQRLQSLPENPRVRVPTVPWCHASTGIVAIALPTSTFSFEQQTYQDQTIHGFKAKVFEDHLFGQFQGNP